MIIKTDKYFDINPIIKQVQDLHMTGRSLILNETTGNLMSGKYTIKEQFVNTPLGNVLESMGDIGEARLLRLGSQESYTAHTDPDDRYHLNIISNEHSYLIDLESKEMYNLPVDGYLYYMDTSIVHTAVNFGATERIHLNVRVRMPQCDVNSYHIEFIGGDFDWKYELYYNLMKLFNIGVKNKTITGLEKINDREIRINCTSAVLEEVKTIARDSGLTYEIN